MKGTLERLKVILSEKDSISKEEFDNLLQTANLTSDEIEELTDFIFEKSTKINNAEEIEETQSNKDQELTTEDLENVEEIEPIEAKGKLSLWDFEYEK